MPVESKKQYGKRGRKSSSGSGIETNSKKERKKIYTKNLIYQSSKYYLEPDLSYLMQA
jgi:hypothetical protein